MGLIRPLVYLSIGFVIGNIYHGCTAEPKISVTKEMAGIERIIENAPESDSKYLASKQYRIR